MITAYVETAVLAFLLYSALFLSAPTHPRSVWNVAIIVLASALWPLTLLIQCAMVLLFIRDLRRWPQ